MHDLLTVSRTMLVSRLRFVAPITLALSITACGATTRPDGGEGLLPIGSDAPALSAIDQNGKEHRLADEKGHPVIVYFYPKDGTPGCTREACAFRDAWDKFKTANVQVFGVSTDDAKSHEEFAKEQKLPFPILADPDSKWLNAFGVPSRLGMASRVSFLIDANGKVSKVYPNVDPGIHADEARGGGAKRTMGARATFFGQFAVSPTRRYLRSRTRVQVPRVMPASRAAW